LSLLLLLLSMMNGLGSGNEGQELVWSRKAEDGKGIQSKDDFANKETSGDADADEELDAEDGGASWICG
jgi:hypothetical protein